METPYFIHKVILALVVLTFIIQLGLIYSRNKKFKELKKGGEILNIVETSVGNIDINKIEQNVFYLEAIKNKYSTAMDKHVGSDFYTKEAVRLYSEITNLMGVTDAYYGRTPYCCRYTKAEIVTALDIVIEKKKGIVKSNWIVIDYNDPKTLPEECDPVLMYIPSWEDYIVGYFQWDDDVKPWQPTWRNDGDHLDKANWPTCWQKIDKNHDKTKTNPEPVKT